MDLAFLAGVVASALGGWLRFRPVLGRWTSENRRLALVWEAWSEDWNNRKIKERKDKKVGNKKSHRDHEFQISKLSITTNYLV
jgi:hypothetical protein